MDRESPGGVRSDPARLDAIERGAKSYFSGRPCKYGHVGLRYVSGSCAECRRTPEAKAKKRAYSASPGGRVPRPGRSSKPGRYDSTRRGKRQGLTPEAFDALLSEQDGKCANLACRAELSATGKSTHVDHNHETGFVRGILCRWCNVALGQAHDSAAILRGLVTYLEKSE